MVRKKNLSRSRKRKFDQQRPQKSQKKPKFSYKNKPAYLIEREARNKELPKKFEPPPIQEKEHWKNIRAESSEDEQEDFLKVLLGTFGNKRPLKTTVVSESESEDEENEVLGKEQVMEDEEDLEDEESADLGAKEDLEDEEDIEDEGDLDEETDLDDEEDLEDEEVLIEKDLGKGSKNKNIQKLPPLEDIDEEIILNYQEEEQDIDPKTEFSDPFSLHLQNDLSDDLYKSISTTPKFESHNLNWPTLGTIQCQIPVSETPKTEFTNTKKKSAVSLIEKTQFAKPGSPSVRISSIDWKDLYVKPQVHVNVSKANYENIKDNLETEKSSLTSLQKELFSIVNNYQDLYYPHRSVSNAEQIRLIYCLHAINHVLKTRMKILRHNLKLSKNRSDEVPDEFRDQGLVRPKVLIVVPFRHSCLKVVEKLIALLIDEGKGGSVMNKKRFMEEFASGEIILPKKNLKPEDYYRTFEGNTDDCFRIGIQVTKKVLKLYSDFYSSDIIVASPVGLKMLIGAEGEPGRDYDFLASIEVMILDQTEIFIMQNWDHLLHLMDHMHLQPKISRGTDFSRIRSWAVNGWTKYYRQTLIFSSFEAPEIHGIFSKRCHNYAGRNKIANPVSSGSASQVFVKIPQVYHRFEASNYSQAIDARFNFFVSKILPQYSDSIMAHTLIVVPTYFDFLKLRNYMMKEQYSFVQICEYSKAGKVARARDIFFHNEAQFLLYSERYHFYKRIRIKGIRHILFYGLPVVPHFYSEICNLMQEGNQNPKGGSKSNMSVTVVYCKFDVLQLSSVVGTERAVQMLTSEKNVHMIITDK